MLAELNSQLLVYKVFNDLKIFETNVSA